MGMKAAGLLLLGVAEWAKGSPLARAGLESLGETERLQLAEILSNGELSAGERKLAEAYRSPRDMANWALAGVSTWGLDESTAPMRAWERASALRELLSGWVGDTQACHDWERSPSGEFRNKSEISRAQPSNAFTLLFKRRRLPGLAGVAILAKGWASSPLLGLSGAMALQGLVMPAVFSGIACALAKGIETMSSHRSDVSRRELMAMRAAMASKKRVDKLARAALSHAVALGYQSSSGMDEMEIQKEAGTIKEREAQARALKKEADKLAKGSALEVLDRADEINELRNKAAELSNSAYRARQNADTLSARDYEDVKRALSRFSHSAQIAQLAAVASKLSELKNRELARRNRRELESSVPEAKASPPRRGSRI